MKNIFISLINFYKKFISPYLEHLGIHCKYEPACSEYTKQAIGFKRILRCNPFSKGGFDPLK